MLRWFALKLFRLYAVRGNTSIDRSVHIGIGTIISATEHLSIDRGTYIGKGCTIQVNGSIGKGVLIANGVGIVGRLDHDYRVVGAPVRYAPWIGDADYRASADFNAAADKVVIEDDVWIGYGAIVLSGARVSRGAIVAAGAVVTRDVGPYEIVAGIPARVVSHRYPPSLIADHEARLAEFWAAWRP